MPIGQVSATDAVVASPAAAAETAVATIPPVETPRGGGGILVRFTGQITVGATGTTLTPTIRRGAGVGGAVVKAGAAQTVAAGNVVPVVIEAFDVPGDVAAEQYTLTLTVGAATGASVVQNVHGDAAVVLP